MKINFSLECLQILSPIKISYTHNSSSESIHRVIRYFNSLKFFLAINLGTKKVNDYSYLNL